MPWLGHTFEGPGPHIEMCGSWQDCNNGYGRNSGRMRLYRVRMIRNAVAAATVRHAGAMPLHLVAAGALRHRHSRIGESARHGRRDERHDEYEYRCELARPAHSLLAYQRPPYGIGERSIACHIPHREPRPS